MALSTSYSPLFLSGLTWLDSCLVCCLSLAQNFRIDEQLSFGIYDVDNCYVVLSDSVPDDSKFFVSVRSARDPTRFVERELF